jgi:hypothetical protein
MYSVEETDRQFKCPYSLHHKGLDNGGSKKLKQSRYTPWRRLGIEEYSSYSFTTSALDGVSGQSHALNGGSEHHGNVTKFLPNYTMQHLRRQLYSYKSLYAFLVS